MSPSKHTVIGFVQSIDPDPIRRLLIDMETLRKEGVTKVTLAISSFGGSPEQGFHAYTFLRALPIELTTYNLHTVQSAAIPLFLAGSKRIATPGSTFMMHGTVRGSIPNNPTDLLHYLAALNEAEDQRSVQLVAERTEQEVEVVREWFSGQKLRDTAFAVQFGIAQEVASLSLPLDVDRVLFY